MTADVREPMLLNVANQVLPRGAWRVVLAHEWHGGSYHELHLLYTEDNGRMWRASEVKFEEYQPGLPRPPWPLFDGQQGEQLIRAMMNAMWDAGFRPDGFNDTKLATAALSEHLGDARAVRDRLLAIVEETKRALNGQQTSDTMAGYERSVVDKLKRHGRADLAQAASSPPERWGEK